MRRFVEDHKISIKTCYGTNENPNAPDIEGFHWRVMLQHKASDGVRHMSLICTTNTGYASLCMEPTAGCVMTLLKQETDGVNLSFEDWAEAWGYDPDSRSAERKHRALKRQTARLKRFLGDAAFDEFLAIED